MQTGEWGRAAFAITNQNGDTTIVHVAGRDRWALEQLMATGKKGCTPIDTLGPRWSGYVFNLREQGIDIETVHESHDGPFTGRHARYVLRSRVQRIEDDEVAA